MRTLTKEEIISAFPVKERKKVKILDLQTIDWEVLDFLGWIHPSGHLGYIVYEFPLGLRGIVLERNPKPLGQNVGMCALCYTIQNASNIRLFAYKIPNSNITIGDYFCADLQCSLYIRKIKDPMVARIEENLTTSQKIERCKINLEKFFSRIDEISAFYKNK
jgi:hypothetical protein